MDYHGRIVRIHVTLSKAVRVTERGGWNSRPEDRPLFGNAFTEKGEKSKALS